MSDLSGSQLGKYTLENHIGRGGMASVYRAYQASLKRYVAIKILHAHLAEDSNFLQRFEREAAAIANLRHPNIISVFDFDHDPTQDLYYMVMELVEGPTLREEVLARQETTAFFDLPTAVRAFTQLASAVDYAHGQGMIHRDIKAANVMFAPSGQVYLADFGLARLIGEARLSMIGTISGTPSYIAPEQIRGESGDERSDIYSLGIVLYEMLTLRLPFEADSTNRVLYQHVNEAPPPPTAVADFISPALEDVLLATLDKNPDKRPQSAAELALAVQEAAQVSVTDLGLSLLGSGLHHRDGRPSSSLIRRLRREMIGPCPYRGLFAFREADAPFFFGRDAFTTAVVEKIGHEPITALLGASGSGKSSLMFAGVVPTLRRRAGWHILTMRPGGHPLANLATAFTHLLEPTASDVTMQAESNKLVAALRVGDVTIGTIVERLGQLRPQLETILLVVDQFEELYTLTEEPARRQRFLDQLLTAVRPHPLSATPTLKLAFTLRADFLGQLLTYRPLTDLLQQGTIVLGPMTRAELTEAIEKPAVKQHVAFEEGLIERILDDVGDEPGNLPLLEFALTSLWEKHDDGLLTHVGYESIGHVAGALARHAEEVYDGLTPAEQTAVRRIMLQLVRPGEGTEDTRRVATRTELGEEAWPLVRRLADARLVVTNRDSEEQDTAEVVHEALIRSWDRLQSWLNEDRTFLAWQNRLRSARDQWQASGQDEGALLRGAPLAEADGWLADRPEMLSTPERTFIETSLALRDREQARREAERRTRERLRATVTIVALVGALVAFGLSLWAINQRNAAVVAGEQAQASQRVAEEQSVLAQNAQATAVAERDLLQIALSQQLAIQSLLANPTQPDLGHLLAVEAFRTSETVEAQSSLLSNLLSHPGLQRFLPQHTDRVQAIAYSPDGRTIATASSDSTILLWSATTGERLGDPLTDHTSIVNSVAFAPDGRWLVSGGNDRTLRRWDLRHTPPTSEVIAEQDALITAVAFDPTGRFLASASADGQLLLWNISGNRWTKTTLTNNGAEWLALAFNPSGETLASAGDDQHVYLWPTADSQPATEPLEGHEGSVTTLAFVDEETLVSGGRDNQILVWDVAAGTLSDSLTAHENWVTAVASAPTGETLVSADRDGHIYFWDTAVWTQIDHSYNQQASWVNDLAVAPDSQTVASASYNGQAALWDMPASHPRPPLIATRRQNHTDRVLAVAYTPDGQTLATAGSDTRLLLWNDATGAIEREIETDSPIRALDISPDGRYVALGSEDGSVQLWDTTQAEMVMLPAAQGHDDFVQSVAFSPDGQLLASSGDDEQIIIWEVATRERQGEPLTGHVGTVWEVAFSADGQALFSAGRDGTIRRWRVGTHLAEGEPLVAHSLPVRAVAISPDGRFFASASDDESVKIWSVGDHTLVHELRGHTAEVETLAFSPDSQYLVSGSADTTLIIWDVAQGQAISTADFPLQAHTDWVFAVAYHPSGERVASGGRDTAVVVWSVAPEAWVTLACGRANRNLDPTEWQNYFGNQPYHPSCFPP